jgi:hypothetical protein
VFSSDSNNPAHASWTKVNYMIDNYSLKLFSQVWKAKNIGTGNRAVNTTSCKFEVADFCFEFSKLLVPFQVW